ncbi:MAG: phosphoglycerate dehydrogenase [Erysipelotrichaceae bacterium]|nr:phosphoglycerate dehydrogenase [Erysipelotrichaceae bacterium]
MKIKLYNKIDKLGLDHLAGYEIGEDLNNEDGIMVRSANLFEVEFPKELKAIARAGAGVNNIPIEECSKQGIAVFNTPGANANAVKELTLCALFLSSRGVIKGNAWAKTVEENYSKAIEKGKSQFVGPEIYGKKLGVIGLGAIGANVANAALALGMDVYGYDPYISVKAAWSLNRAVKYVANLNELFKEVDYITVHVPSLDSTRGFINKNTIATMKDNVRILNFARGDLINEKDMIEALNTGKVAAYVTDFGSVELNKCENAIVLPHLGASTPESEENCAVMAAKELREYLETGNITNSVNLPSISEPWTSKHRICIIHKNVPNMLAQFATLIGQKSINIENMYNKAKDEYAYTVIDTNDHVEVSDFEKIDNVVRVRLINR